MGILDRVADTMKNVKFEISATILAREQELREVFGQE
jgi:hypothetical protein